MNLQRKKRRIKKIRRDKVQIRKTKKKKVIKRIKLNRKRRRKKMRIIKTKSTKCNKLINSIKQKNLSYCHLRMMQRKRSFRRKNQSQSY